MTVLVVEDHPVVRVGLRTILEESPRFELVGEVGTCKEALLEANRLHPDIVLLDLRLPDGSGVEVCRDILETNPEAKVLFLTSYQDEDSILAAVLAGAAGYLLKDVGWEGLMQAVEVVADGHTILDRWAVERVQAWARGDENPPPGRTDWDLTPQQLRILALVAEGKTNKEIGTALSLSDKTVRNYLVTIFEKLHITRRSQAAARGVIAVSGS